MSNELKGRRIFVSIAVAAALIILSAAVVFRPDVAATVAAGLTAHNLCSARFVAGQDIDVTFNEEVGPLIGPARHLVG